MILKRAYLSVSLCVIISSFFQRNTNSLEAKSAYASDYDPVYEVIPDIYHPTYDDFLIIQEYLNHGNRPYLKWLNDSIRMDIRARNIKLMDPSEPLDLELHTMEMGQKSDWCVVSYASLNHNYGYAKKIKEMRERFKEKGFPGHFLYRIGGWPNIDEGSLRLAHVPYAFKICMMKEAKKLGYTIVLWADTSMVPLKNFDEIFRIIEKEGYFALKLPYTLGSQGSEISRKALELTEAEYNSIPQMMGGLIGINFAHPNGQALFEAWMLATENLDTMLSSRPEQIALGAIMHKLKLPFFAQDTDICRIYTTDTYPDYYFHIGY